MIADPEQAPRVVIADDQALVRGGFRLILNSAGIPVVAEAGDGKEAIAAVLKHAGTARPVVRVEYRPRELRIKVSDDGRPADSGVANPQPPGSGGRGLIGLRERIAIYGGELDAGPRPGGGWQVSARIPLESVADGLEKVRTASRAASS